MTDDDQTKIDWVKTIAGALAAVTTAVLLSTLGAAGTLIGAALGSVLVTVSSQLYAQGLARSKRTMAKAQEAALQKAGLAQAEVRRAGRRNDTGAVQAHLDAADDQLDGARAALDGGEPTASLRERLALLPWKRIGLSAAGAFLLALVVIASFEAVTGRSVSSYTGGSDRDSSSTFTGDGSSSDDDGNEDQDRQDRPEQDPTGPTDGSAPSDAPSEGPAEEPSDPAPSVEPTQEPSESPAEVPEQAPSPSSTPTTPAPTASP
ncbi:hypothetical protein [Nocardioides dongkuii]|uniref:hypothetical protein n=1 Tax=Nocardioides dongkuii TaxID=2760089 RepID=UPI0015FCCA3B|nr:hypothetical protein [Nocardioides dongkuii]